uniref:Ig-like domain-containing protein n=1 Tax=Labrus bergylta TaxID=56723 RepID=A0A3Q3GUZ2_9LABR
MVDSVGKTVKIEGRVSGSQPLTVTWYKDNSEIYGSDKYDVSFHNNMAVLCVRDSSTYDSGEYTCTASNEAGEFDIPLEPTTVNEGEKLSIKCHVIGSAPLNIQWMKDRRELTSSGNTRITFVGGNASLEVSSASKSDAGDYLCKASNANGSNFCKSRVTVTGALHGNLSSFTFHIKCLHCIVTTERDVFHQTGILLSKLSKKVFSVIWAFKMI